MRVKDKAVIFIEAQSTWSINILIKLMIYYVTEIKNYISVHELNIHSKHRIPLPKLDFYVVYTGKEQVPSDINLTDLFFDGVKAGCEISAKVITQGNEESNDFFFQYIEFTHIMDLAQQEYKDTGMKAIEIATAEATTKATAEGKAKGMIEGRKETAVKMKRLGLDIQIIIECTGLSKEQIENL